MFNARFTRRDQDKIAASLLALGETVAFTRDGEGGSLVLDVTMSSQPGWVVPFVLLLLSVILTTVSQV